MSESKVIKRLYKPVEAAYYLGIEQKKLKKRDHIDSTREDSPLSKAIDALEMDTSEMTLELQG